MPPVSMHHSSVYQMRRSHLKMCNHEIRDCLTKAYALFLLRYHLMYTFQRIYLASVFKSLMIKGRLF